MPRIILFLLLFLWFTASFQVRSQPSEPQAFSFIDLAHAQALLQQGEAVPEDSQLIALLTVARDHLEVHMRLDSTLRLAEEVLSRAKQKAELRGIAANACFKKAQALRFSDWVVGEETGGLDRVWTMDEYVPWYHQAAEMGLEAKDYTLVRAVYAELSEIYQEVSQDDSAQHYLQKSLALAKQYGDVADVASAYVALGGYYVNHLYIDQGRAYVDSIKAKLDSLPEPRRLWVESSLYEMESGLAARVENFPEALRANYLALEALRKLDNPVRIMTAELLQGAFWRRVGILDSAVAYFYAARDRMEANQIESVNHRYAIHHMLEGTMVEMNNVEAATRYRLVVDSLRHLAAPILAGKYALAEMNLALETGNLARYRAIYEQTDWESLRAGPNQLKSKIDLLEARVAYLVDKNPAKAIALYRVIRETMPASGDGKVSNLTVINTYYHSARCHLLLGQPQAAMASLAQAERLMAGYAVLPIKAKVFLVAMQAAQQLKDVETAQQYERRYDEALDEQSFAQYNMASQMAETRYRTQQIQAERDLQIKERELVEQKAQQNLQIAGLAGGGLLAVLLLSVFLFRSREQQRKLTAEVTQQRDQQVQLTTEVAQQRDRNETLLRELNHRVKNNLQQISGLLLLQGRRAPQQETKDALKVSQQRMETMSLLHTLLYQGEEVAEVNLRDYLSTLIHNLLSAYGYPADRIKLDLSLADLTVNMDQGISLGLIANEWITNALKYALPDAPYLRVSLQLLDAQTAELTVADQGPGLPPGFDPMTASSYGLQLVQTMSEQMYGEVSVESEVGTQWRLRFGVGEVKEELPYTATP